MAGTKLVIRDPLLSAPLLFLSPTALSLSFSCPPFLSLSLETVRRLDSCLPRELSPCYRKFLSLSAKTFRHSVSFVVAGAVRVRGVREAQRVSLVNGGARSCLLSARASPRGYCCQRGARTGRPRARAKAVRARSSYRLEWKVGVCDVHFRFVFENQSCVS